MRVFVTGATGFVGGHLVETLIDAGATVTAIVRSPDKAKEIARRGVTILEGDLSDAGRLADGLSGHDAVVHVAGLIAAPTEQDFLAVNRDGTARLIQAAEQAQVTRFLLVSSAAAGGPSTDRPLDGTEPPAPVTQYGRSKLAGEECLRRSALDWTIVRPPAVYGPADREMLRVFRAAAAGIGPVFGDGSMRLSLIYGPDLGRALVDTVRSSNTIRGTYYAAHPEILTSRELIRTLGRVAGRRVRILPIPRGIARAALTLTGGLARLTRRTTVLTADKANEFFQDAWTCDPGRLMVDTGWRPEFDLERGARATFEWYHRHRWL